MIALTEAAAREVGRIAGERNHGDERILRVKIEGGGCSGFQYNLFFDEASNVDEETDEIYDFHGVKVVIDRKSDVLMNGTTIDWHDGLNGRGFAFNNPNAQKTCGCGSSFSA